MTDRKPIHKTAARTALLLVLIAVISILSLRIIYFRQKNQLTNRYITEQEQLSEYIAKDLQTDINGIINALLAIRASGVMSDGGESVNSDSLLKIMNSFNGIGALDLMALNDSSAPVSATGYLATTGMTPDEIHEFIMNIWSSANTDTFVSETIQVDSREEGAGYIIMAGVDFDYASGGDARGKEADGEINPGLLVIILSVQDINKKIQSFAATAANRMVFALDRNGFIVSHPHPEFIGSGSADTLYTENYPELNKVVERMKMGEKGKDEYIALDSETGRKNTLWNIGFSPVKNAGLSVAVTFQHSDIPDVDRLVSIYMGLSIAVIVFLLVGYGVFIRERNRFLLMERFAGHLGDAAAVNEMLTNINSDITDDKRSLEGELIELKSIFMEREASLKKILELYDQLEASLKKPSRNQRGLLNDLMKEIKTLSKTPENRFRKTASRTNPGSEEDEK